MASRLPSGSLCTGYGGLEIAIDEIFEGVEVQWVADTSEAAGAVLAEHFPDAPNLGDIKTIDWSQVPGVDILTAGVPCQPYSLAGKQKGEEDERDLVGYLAEAVSTLRPRLVLVENVSGFRRGGMPRLLGALAQVGYDAKWGSVLAAQAGAPHRRERVFILAYPQDVGLEWARAKRKRGGDLRSVVADTYGQPGQQWRSETTGDQTSGWVWPDAGGPDRLVTLPTPTARDSKGVDKKETLLEAKVRLMPTPKATDITKGYVNHKDSSGHPSLPGLVGMDHWGKFAEAIERWEGILKRKAPAPTELGRNGNPRLSAPFVEWMMGLPEGWVTAFGFTRGKTFTMLGNGVVSQQAALAIEGLLEESNEPAYMVEQLSRLRRA